jgi:hypothetical protein
MFNLFGKFAPSLESESLQPTLKPDIVAYSGELP